MNEEMNRVFGDWGGEGSQGSRMTWAPPIEVRQRDGRMVITAELPGMRPEDVNVEMNDDSIVIHGERRDEREQNQGGVHVSERRYGQFHRTIPLPEGAKAENVTARFNNGLLEIDVPMEQQQQASRRQIPVQTGSGQQENQQGSQSQSTRAS